MIQIQYISIYNIILLFNLLWLLSFLNLVYATNFIIILISFEMMFLSICVLFCVFSFIMDNLTGQLMALFILGIVAAESAIGLAIYIALHKSLDYYTE